MNGLILLVKNIAKEDLEGVDNYEYFFRRKN